MKNIIIKNDATIEEIIQAYEKNKDKIDSTQAILLECIKKLYHRLSYLEKCYFNHLK